ncbi:MAG: PSD1 and planctomycete cytochrome C domain-containing protein [Pirellula sp.]
MIVPSALVQLRFWADLKIEAGQSTRLSDIPILLVAMFLFLGGNTDVARAEGPNDNQETISFTRDIRPILSDLCFACHGPDPAHRKADLRLDLHEGAMTVITTSSADSSELVRRMLSHDVDERMPPSKSVKQPTQDQIKKIQQWINEGAKWQEHWSFAPLVKPNVPVAADANKTMVRNPIDHFVQQQLNARGWTPAPEADRRTLIRRVAIDLTGLPPSIDEVDRFVADTSPDAYEQVVSRLLQSKAFGERMAWDWLDAARYADSNGYQGDSERTMWPWRDWVVRAFNENLPFDQFTVWQLAGDMLPNATMEQKLATAFCRNHMINGEGGRIAEENRVDYAMDMTETMGTVWLGLTLNCCRCHDHKFDPIKQEEYYRFLAFFNQTPVDGAGRDPKTAPILRVPTPEQRSILDAIAAEIASAEGKISSRSKELAVAQAEWENGLRAAHPTPAWDIALPITAKALKQTMGIEKDQTIVTFGDNPDNDTYEIELDTHAKRVAAIRLDALQHKSMTKNSLSRAESGNFVLTSLEVYRVPKNSGTNSADSNPNRIPLKLSDAQATFEQGEHKARTAIDDDPTTGWAVWEGRVVDRPHSAIFRLEEPIRLDEGERLLVFMRHDSMNAQHNMGYFRLSTSDVYPETVEPFDPAFDSALAKSESDRSKPERELVIKQHQQSDSLYSTLEKELTGLKERQRNEKGKIPEVMIMAERDKPRDTFMLQRGLYNEPGKKVTAGVPGSLPPLFEGANVDRLAMARWLVSPNQPLTARVIVNRFWQQFFGTGLSKTVEDLGSQGEIPRYLELHDWLAAEFRDSGWNTKRLLELIVTSHTYRQSSRFSDSPIAQDDPENRYLARGARFRMPSWMIRDQALAVSGLLVDRLGGPSVNTYQPEGVWEEATFGNKKYRRDSGDSLYRRSLYIFWRRIIGPTMFFDNAARQVCTVKVTRTNTPLQALFVLNDVTFVEAARALAASTFNSKTRSDTDRIDHIYQCVLARRPSPQEQEVLLKALDRSRIQFAKQSGQVRALLAVGESKVGVDIDQTELASWTALSLAVLNLDETLTKE